MLPRSVQRYLDERGAGYRVLQHSPRSTAQETAQAAHVSGKRFAKLVVLKVGDGEDEFVLAVLPAHELVSLYRLGVIVGGPLRLASEDEVARLFPDCELGAAPPFGELAGLPVYADACLGGEGSVVFHGGRHTELIEMSWNDYASLASPRIYDYGRPALAPTPEDLPR